jgi:signal transduction histidine kinase
LADRGGSEPRRGSSNDVGQAPRGVEIADRAPAPEWACPDLETVLSALDRALAIVAPNNRVLFVSRAWARAFGRTAAECVRRDLFSCFPQLASGSASATMRAARADGAPRQWHLAATPGGSTAANAGTAAVRVACTDDDILVLELVTPVERQARLDDVRGTAEFAPLDESAALRLLARQMAEVSDSGRLLAILCDAASALCRAQGAAVIKVVEGEGEAEVVAAAGKMAVASGRRFPLSGSLVEAVLASHDTLAVSHFSASGRPLARVLPELRVGPVVVAPLVAHHRPLGVLAIARGESEPPFGASEEERLGVIADHAALALWKAELLDRTQSADRAKGRFLATISHELRTPLTALTGYEELLADEVIGPLSDPQSDVVQRMRSVTHHLAVMIEEVLAYSSLEAGREVVRPTDFLAHDLVRAVAAIIEPLARQKKLPLVCELPAAPVRMTSDVDKVRQILVNLAGNAVKFTEVGEVRIILEPPDAPGGEVRLSVRDTGVGLSSEQIGQLFRPFSQLDTGLTRRHGGTGLGLYISHRLAELIGGRIEVRSEPGVGSTFVLVVPGELP